MKNVLITGASRGIGRACAYEFSKKGFKVFINYNKNRAAAERLAEETGQIAVCADVSNAAQVKKMTEFIQEKYGGISVLINNAGISLSQQLITDTTEVEWDGLFNTNVKSMFLVTKAVLPGMIHEKNGSIINLSSMWGITGGSCEVAYSASKAAVIGFTKALAKEVGPSGIIVNCIAPGVINTDMNNNLSYDDIKELKNETPLGKIGTPEDIARTAVFLAEEKFITGEVINVNGGIVI